MLRNYLGDRSFYRRVLRVAIPILIQFAITNFVSLLDNIMVGQIGTLQMSGVSIVNELLFVFNYAVFGITSGAGIFTAQFFGSGNEEGVRLTQRYKTLSCLAISLLFIAILLPGRRALIGLFLRGEGSATDAAQILQYGQTYLLIMLLGLIPFALSYGYAGTLRECGQTLVPMIASAAAVLTNLALNYILIFGRLGLPALGVAGAAIATVISRFVELAIVAGWTHCNPQKNPFIRGVYRSFRIPLTLFKQLIKKGLPLLMNEVLWSFAVTFVNQCYSTCGLEVVSAVNITSTIANLTNIVSFALGNTIGILLGQMLGAGRPKEEVRTESRRLIFLSILFGIVFAGILACLSPLYPRAYNTTDAIRALASGMILIQALFKPAQAYAAAGYYTIRSGGQILITFLYDSGSLWLLSVPLAFCLSRFTDISILPLYFICQLPDVAKAIFGAVMIRKEKWMQNLTVQSC